MGFPDRNKRKALLLDHPVLMGLVWALLSALLFQLVSYPIQHEFLSLGQFLLALATFALVSPAWAYGTRWFILRSMKNAR